MATSLFVTSRSGVTPSSISQLVCTSSHSLSTSRTCSPLLKVRSRRASLSSVSTSLELRSRSDSQCLMNSGNWNGLYRTKTLQSAGTGASVLQGSTTRNSVVGGVARAEANGSILSLVAAVAIPLIAGVANALVNNPATPWYKNLKKPSWNPPDWLFGAAWGILYPVMGLASWLVWSEGGFQKQVYPLTAYAVQLFLNLLWPAIFFRAKKIGLALVDISALLVVVAATIVLFKPVNPLAAYLLIPYLAWVAFATVLNYNYWVLNRNSGDQFIAQTA